MLEPWVFDRRGFAVDNIVRENIFYISNTIFYAFERVQIVKLNFLYIVYINGKK